MPPLTSPGLLGAAGLLAVLAALVTGVAMGRLRGRARGLRVTLLMGVSVLLVVTTTALAINVKGLYVRRLADLFAVEAPADSVTPVESGEPGPFPVAGHPGDPGWSPTLTPAGAGMVGTRWRGPESGITQGLQIWLPPGYRTDDGRRYHVLMLLHGYPGSYEGTAKAFRLPTQMEAALAAGSIPDTIVVVPGIGASDGRSSSCADTGGHRDATWLSRDVPSLLLSLYPNIVADRSAWAVGGISAGAWCAGHLALDAPRTWSSAILLSGYDAPLYGPLATADPTLREANTLSVMAARRPADAPPLRMFVSGTRSDPDAEAVTAALAEASGPRLQITATTVSGGHNWRTWNGQLPDVMRWLGSGTPAGPLGATELPTGGGADTVAPFSPRSPWIVGGIGVLALGAFAGVAGWGIRRPRPGAGAVLARTTAVLAVGLLVALAVVLAVNLGQAFVVAWSELPGLVH